MKESDRDLFLHDWVIDEIHSKYSREFTEIRVNKSSSKEHQLEGQYPDIIFGNHGQVVMIGEVEVESTLNESSIKRWKDLQSIGYQLIIFVPKSRLKFARDFFWDNKLIEKIKISSFSVEIPIT